MNVEDYLKLKNIVYIVHEHPAVYTCEEAEKHCSDIPGLACKNLFLRGKKSGQYFLIILPAEKRAELKRIELLIEEKITFASPDDLMEKLGLEPGSVSPFGLINDSEHEIIVLIDQDVYSSEIVGFHPNRNTATLELSRDMFHNFLESLENKILVVDL